MFCPKCGTEVDETDNFCYNCGERLDFEKKGEEKGITSTKKTKAKRNKKETINVKLDCYIKGMDINGRPNGSFFEIRVAKAGLKDAIDRIKSLPKKNDFPEDLLKNLKRKSSLCPPTVIFTNDYALEVFTFDGEKVCITTKGFSKLAGYEFMESGGKSRVVEVTQDEAIEIVTEFFRKADRIKKLRLGLTPLEFSTLLAIKNGISNSRTIASVTGTSVDRIRDTVRELIHKGFIVSRKKGIFRKKYWYELTPEGEKKLNNGRKRLEKAVKEDRDIIDVMTPVFWIMYATQDVLSGVDENDIVSVIGEPPEILHYEVTGESVVDFDTGDVAEDDGVGDGDWWDGDGDDGW